MLDTQALSKPTRIKTPLEQEAIDKHINHQELLTAIRFWAFRCPSCGKYCLKMTDIKTDSNDRHGFYSNRMCYNCHAPLDYDRDLIGDSHYLDSYSYDIGDFLVYWAIEGKTKKGEPRVQPYLKTKCVFCNQEHYLPLRDNRISFKDCLCQNGTSAAIQAYADGMKAANTPKPKPIEERPIIDKELPELVPCEFCGQYFKPGKSMQMHHRLAHDHPSKGPIAIMKHKKACGHCKQVKPFSEFGTDKSRPDGLANRCKACETERAKQRRVNPPTPAEKEEATVEQAPDAKPKFDGKSKYCPRCKQLKPITEFSSGKGRQGGHDLQSYCKPCASDYNKERKERKRTGLEGEQMVTAGLLGEEELIKQEVERIMEKVKTGEEATKPYTLVTMVAEEPMVVEQPPTPTRTQAQAPTPAQEEQGFDIVKVKIPSELVDRVKELCFDKEITKSQLFIEALKAYLEAGQ